MSCALRPLFDPAFLLGRRPKNAEHGVDGGRCTPLRRQGVVRFGIPGVERGVGPRRERGVGVLGGLGVEGGLSAGTPEKLNASPSSSEVLRSLKCMRALVGSEGLSAAVS